MAPRYVLDLDEQGIPERTLVPIADDLGSVLLVVDAATGEVVQRTAYGGFGEMLSRSGADEMPFGFGGGLHDNATGLTRFGARDVSHETGRWLSRDPMRFKSGSMNLFLYADADPQNALDPTGLATFRCERPTTNYPEVGPLKHEYICVRQGEHMICNGMEQSGSMFGSPGQPTNDADGNGPDQFTGRCRQVREDDTCLESCIAGKLESRKRPFYSFPFGTDCQRFVDSTLRQCDADCGLGQPLGGKCLSCRR